MCIAHEQDGVAIIDRLEARDPPFDADQVTQEFASILRQYGCASVLGDNAAMGMAGTLFSRHGVRYEKTTVNKTSWYQDFSAHLTSGNVRLIDDEVMLEQLSRSKSRRTSPAARP